MVTFSGPPSGAIRNKPITAELKQILEAAAQAAGVEAVRITSGGQDALGEGPNRTGSTRHDRGRAADLQLVISGSTESFTDHSAPASISTFITAAAAGGATGIGAGVGYMGNKTIHVGFGKSPSDTVKLTWGAGGQSVNAPNWLRNAAQAGWSAEMTALASVGPSIRAPGRYVVIARNGLKLRGGPGTNFESQETLAVGTELNVVDIGGEGSSWARVDLTGDGLLDGYVFASFLAAAGATASNELAPEPA